MPENWAAGHWLLIDAAGPALVTGLLKDGDWLEFRQASDGFLECLQPEVAALLARHQLSLTTLHGCLFASGPGSTLGLRLAALFLRTLLQLPELAHWTCYAYNTLALACAATLDPDHPARASMLAPWRRDRLHGVTFLPEERRFALFATHPDAPVVRGLPMAQLGNRAAISPADRVPRPTPFGRVPHLFAAFPDLLTPVTVPALYQAEETVFARWKPQRHRPA